MRRETFDRIKELSAEATKAVKGKSIEDMEDMFERLAEQNNNFLINQGDLGAAITPEHPQFGKLETTLTELIQHVVNHGTYHRGNLTAMIRQLGHQSVSTDYIFYLYDQKAATK